MLKRRTLIQGTLAGIGASMLPAAQANELHQQLQESDLIYLTPIQSNGRESRCQSEIWYVWDGTDIFVCTETTTWRARAAASGLDHTRIWVGDLGNWKNTDGAYKALPSIDAATSVVSDETVHAKALDMFGDKYPLGWIRWGSTFRKGLASGSRTLIQYRPL